MWKYFFLTLLLQLPAMAFAQEVYTDYLQAEKKGRGKVVLHGDGTGGAILLALHTADASALADLAHVGTLVFIGAFNDDARRVLHKADDAVGAGLNAEAATNALGVRDLCNAALDGDGVVLADLHTVAVTKAGEAAEAVAAERGVS